MNKFTFPKLTIVLIFSFVFQIITVPALAGSISGFSLADPGQSVPGVRNGETRSTTPFQDLLLEYNSYADLVVEDVVMIYDNAYYLDQALKEGDDLIANMLIDEQEILTDSLLETVESWNTVERGIQVAMGTPGARMIRTDRAGPRFDPLTIAAAGLAIYSIYEFAKKSKELSKQTSDGRALQNEGIDQNDPDKIKQGKEMKNKAGEDMIHEVGVKVTTELITAPFEPETSLGKLALQGGKDFVIEPGLSVITSTKDCQTGISSSGCRIGVGKTDSEGKVTVPPGNLSVSASGGPKGNARVAVEATVLENGTTTVVHQPVPITEATPDAVSQAETQTTTIVQTETGETVEPGATEGEGTGGDSTVGTDETGNISDFLLGSWNVSAHFKGVNFVEDYTGKLVIREGGTCSMSGTYQVQGGGSEFLTEPGTWSYDGQTLTLNLEGYVFSGSASPNSSRIVLTDRYGYQWILTT